MTHLQIPRSPVLGLLVIILAAGAAAQTERAKLLPGDGAAGDQFGTSVAISGTTAIIGASFDDDMGANSGSAYIFDTTTSVQLLKLVAADGEAGDFFGQSVAIDGTLAIVGSMWDDPRGKDSGSAYLFDNTTGVAVAKLVPGDGEAGDWFGRSVAISGAIAIVGAPMDDGLGANSGSAYLFDTTTGAQIAKLIPGDGAAGDQAGGSVAISGGIAIVGARFDDDKGTDSGSVYLFDTATGAQIAKLVPSDGAAGDWFGSSVALDGTSAIIGAAWDDEKGTDSGSAYLFDIATGAQIAKLVPGDGAAGDYFGSCVGIWDATAIGGALFHDETGKDFGAAYLFDAATGTQTAKLLPSDGGWGDLFGSSVAIGSGTALVGALQDDDMGGDSGAAYLFDTPSPPCNVMFCDTDADNLGDVTLNTCDCSAGSILLTLSTTFTGQFTYPLVGLGTTAVSPTGVSELCLAGSTIGRYSNDAGVISASGSFSVDLLNAASAPGGGVPTMGGSLCNGSTWRFQYWHRDGMNPSRFSKGISGLIN